jgi:hypothetical protein
LNLAELFDLDLRWECAEVAEAAVADAVARAEG